MGAKGDYQVLTAAHEAKYNTIGCVPQGTSTTARGASFSWRSPSGLSFGLLRWLEVKP